MDQPIESPQVPAPDPTAPVAVSAPAPADLGFGVRELLLIGLAVVGGGLITYALLMGRAVPTHAAGTPSTASDPAAKREARTAAPQQQWTATRRELWLGARRKGVAFDLNADENVSVWMKTVRPILVVRCTGGAVEAFVVTETPAQIEPKTDAHTVTLRFDGQPSSTEKWPDSTDHDALFAPNGAAFAARLAAARELEFGFIPHNAAPVVARFNVAGLAPLLQPAAKHCGM